MPIKKTGNLAPKLRPWKTREQVEGHRKTHPRRENQQQPLLPTLTPSLPVLVTKEAYSHWAYDLRVEGT